MDSAHLELAAAFATTIGGPVGTGRVATSASGTRRVLAALHLSRTPVCDDGRVDLLRHRSAAGVCASRRRPERSHLVDGRGPRRRRSRRGMGSGASNGDAESWLRRRSRSIAWPSSEPARSRRAGRTFAGPQMQTADTRLRLRLLLAVAGILGVAFVSAAVYLPRYPAFRARPLASEIAATEFRDPKDALALKKDLLQYETDNQIKIWTALAQALGAIVIAGGVYFTWRNLLIAQQNLRATELKLDVDRQGQITNRFTHAVGSTRCRVEGGATQPGSQTGRHLCPGTNRQGLARRLLDGHGDTRSVYARERAVATVLGATRVSCTTTQASRRSPGHPDRSRKRFSPRQPAAPLHARPSRG